MSDSASTSPGGQPSTTAPIAGPWLSPKVVTQQGRPMVLPDMESARRVGGVQQENLGVSPLEFEPGERQVPEAAAYARRGVPDFDHEDSAGSQVASRAGDDALDHGEAAVRGAKARLRLCAMLSGQAPHFGDGH